MEDDEQDETERADSDKGQKGNRIRPREKYRVLIDILDEHQALIAIGDRKARFALMILAAFNAAIIVGGTMGYKAMSDLPEFARVLCLAALLSYGLTAIYFFILAIDALRPRKAPVSSADLAVGTHDSSGLRFFGEILRHKKDDYWTQIQELDYPRVNRELAYQIHGLANLIRMKYDAIAHLYSGMRILTLGAAAIIVIVAGAVSAFYFAG